MDILYVVSNGKGANDRVVSTKRAAVRLSLMAANLMPFDEWKV